MPTIYQIKNKANGKCYVGSAAQVNKRWNSHLSLLNKGLHHSPALQRAWVKYGSIEFEFAILERVADAQEVIAREQHWIDTLRAAHPSHGYNVAPAAGTRAGVPQPESVKRRSSEVHKGVPKSAETRRKMSEAAKGRPKSEAHRQKLREATQRQFADPAARAAAAERQRGKPSPMKGKTLTDEHRAKIAEAANRPDRVAIAIGNLPEMTQELRDRIAAAKKGKRLGIPRPDKRSPSAHEIAQMLELRDQGVSYRAIGEKLGRDVATVFKYAKRSA